MEKKKKFERASSRSAVVLPYTGVVCTVTGDWNSLATYEGLLATFLSWMERLSVCSPQFFDFMWLGQGQA